MGTKERMIHAIGKELALRKDFLSQIDTLYFGGGTPSLLSESELASIFQHLHAHYVIAETIEITLEANPDDISVQNLKLWRTFGINRLSIGCQTFDDETLSRLNRIHRADHSLKAFALAREHGFDNLSIDLMFGLPGQTHELWEQDLKIACALRPEHISAYGLTIEPKTVFGNQAEKGLLNVPNENTQAEYYEKMMEVLNTEGYDQYEISNFSLPGLHSQHNSSYWEQEKYLGIGPSAHSFDGEHRMWNPSNNKSYMKAVEAGELAYTIEVLSNHDRIHEYILTALRTKKGLSTQKLVQQLAYPKQKLDETVQLLQKFDWIHQSNDQIFLTQSGKLLADEITLKFFLT